MCWVWGSSTQASGTRLRHRESLLSISCLLCPLRWLHLGRSSLSPAAPGPTFYPHGTSQPMIEKVGVNLMVPPGVPAPVLSHSL